MKTIEGEIIKAVSDTIIQNNLFEDKKLVGDILQKELDRLVTFPCTVWHSIKGFNVFTVDRIMVEIMITSTVVPVKL
jgi:hypothetical protein